MGGEPGMTRTKQAEGGPMVQRQHQDVFLAVDLGASGGRVVAGLWNGQHLELEEIHRFENGPIDAAGRLYWDLLRLWSEVQVGMRRAAERFGNRVVSIGVDTWGVDFGLLDRDDRLLGNPVHYRDQRTVGTMPRVDLLVPRQDLFAQTGIQFMELNTLYQLFAMRSAREAQLETARSFLMIPDLFHWLLTGEKSNEQTNATTTQCYNPTTRTWATDLLRRLEIPTEIFGPLSLPGTRLGGLRAEVRQATGLNTCQVILPGSHDTASAVMAVPAEEGRQDWCYLSSGTWSLMGVETDRPVLNADCLRLNFTNEGGVGNTIRLLKNITGLWLVQQCRQSFARAGQSLGWDELVRLAECAPPLQFLLNPEDASFVAPTDMPRAIAEYCVRTGQRPPSTPGEFIRGTLESLALRYRQVLGWLEELLGRRLSTIHIVGGGSQNRLLCQMAADACQREVIAGPIEATALGNLLTQAIASGALASIGEARRVVRASFPTQRYQPIARGAWDEAYERFERLSRSPEDTL